SPVIIAAIVASIVITPISAPVVIPAPMETMAAIVLHAQRRPDAPFAPPAGARSTPFVAAPAAMDPVFPPSIPVAVIERAVIPIAVIEHRPVIDRQIPEIVRA